MPNKSHARSARWRTILASSLVVVFTGLGVAPAHAASFSSSMSQVQPTFQSRSWSDTTAGTTTITLSACAGNSGGNPPSSGYVKTVRIALYRNNTLVASATRAPCGAFTFASQQAGTFYFRVAAINGVTIPTTGAFGGTFLNANVSVSY